MKKYPIVSLSMSFRWLLGSSVSYKFVLKYSSHNFLLLLLFLCLSRDKALSLQIYHMVLPSHPLMFPWMFSCFLTIFLKHVTPNDNSMKGLFCILILPLFLTEKDKLWYIIREFFLPNLGKERLNFPCFLFSFFLLIFNSNFQCPATTSHSCKCPA